MDLLALTLTGLLLRVKRRRGRLLLAAAIGALYSVFSVFLTGNTLLSFALTLFSAALLCYIAYDFPSPRRFIGIFSAFFVLSFALGGAITAFYQFLSSVFWLSEISAGFGGKMTVFIIISSLAAGILYILQRVLERNTERTLAEITVMLGGKSKNLTALLDSGNLLRDPAAGTPAIVLRLSSVASVLPYDILRFAQGGTLRMSGELSLDSMRRIRLIPAGGIGGGELLLGVRPDRIWLSVVKKNGRVERRDVDAILALCLDTTADFGGYDAIAPATLAA
jgi:stage II sporulation protein GA (sporulation sigma-E factor processing peptidase)